MAPPPIARDKIAAYGLDAICDDLRGGKFIRQIARELGVTDMSLREWISADDSRSQACARAREDGAEHWDAKSAEVIETAADQFELAKARELAVHYRWRAKAIAPRQYGDKVQTELTGAGGTELVIRHFVVDAASANSPASK